MLVYTRNCCLTQSLLQISNWPPVHSRVSWCLSRFRADCKPGNPTMRIGPLRCCVQSLHPAADQEKAPVHMLLWPREAVTLYTTLTATSPACCMWLNTQRCSVSCRFIFLLLLPYFVQSQAKHTLELFVYVMVLVLCFQCKLFLTLTRPTLQSHNQLELSLTWKSFPSLPIITQDVMWHWVFAQGGHWVEDLGLQTKRGNGTRALSKPNISNGLRFATTDFFAVNVG